jgi:hypothetical protein
LATAACGWATGNTGGFLASAFSTASGTCNNSDFVSSFPMNGPFEVIELGELNVPYHLKAMGWTPPFSPLTGGAITSLAK